MSMLDKILKNKEKRQNDLLNINDLISLDRLKNGIGYFRYYQVEMFNEIIKSFNCDEQGFIFQAGTGTGKTEVFKFIPPYYICKRNDEGNKEGLVFGLVCHRISLINDLGKRIIPMLINKYRYDANNLQFMGDYPSGIGLNPNKLKFYIVNSNTNCSLKVDNNEEANQERIEIENKKAEEIDNAFKQINLKDKFNIHHINEYSKESLIKEIGENKKNGIHSFFICLYQSIGIKENSIKLQKLNFDFIICDEIHALNVMGNEIWKNNISFYETVNKRYFFSATPQLDKNDDRYIDENHDSNSFQYVEERNF